jgi:hypothetical protein
MAISEDKKNLELADIQMILRDLLKVFKVVALYPEDNPLPESLRRTFSERLIDLVTDYDGLDFEIKQSTIIYESEVAYTDSSREDSLAGLFFETGIIRITFEPELEIEEVYRLLDAVKTYQNGNHQTADLAANLWEAGLQHFKFETVEDIALRQYNGDALMQALEQAGTGGYQQAGDGALDYGDIFNDTDSTDPLESDSDGFENSVLPESDPNLDVSEAQAGPILSTGDSDEDESLQISKAVEAMGFGDLTDTEPTTPKVRPDTKVIVNDELELSEEEQEQVETLVRRDAEFVEYESLCELTKEMLHQESEMTDFYESVTIGERVLIDLVTRGKLSHAAGLLRYFVKLEEQLRSDRPLWAERLKDARVTTGSRERLTILCTALNDNSEIGSSELRGYLDNFEWEALMGITDMLGDLTNRLHRDTVTDYLTLRGKDRVHIVARGITDKRPHVVAASATILARIGSEPALQHLAKGVDHEHPEVRRSMARALAESNSDDTLPLLRRLVADTDRRVQQLAIDAILVRRGQRAFETLVEVLNDDQFPNLDLDAQRAVLIAYSKLGGDMAVNYLATLGEKMNLFGNANIAFYREAAFEALAHNRGEKAERTLVKLTSSWRSEIKGHARAALQRRRELIYGGDDDPSE